VEVNNTSFDFREDMLEKTEALEQMNSPFDFGEHFWEKIVVWR
jgi:hypothetical protein